MTTTSRVPPGRAGRLWLLHRRAVASRGADQLERKVQILSLEVNKQRRIAAERKRSWDERCRTAQTWALRAGLIAGADGVRHARPAGHTVVRVEWTTTIGVRHPASAVVSFPPRPDVVASAALVCAARAHAEALQAALDAALADTTLSALDDALLTTRRRARVLRHHWIPELQRLLAELELVLEQAEQEDYTRLRRTLA